MGIADWTVPFELTSKVYTNAPIPSSTAPDPLPINQPIAFALSGLSGIYLLRQDGCSLTNGVRATKDFVPQADGAILHRRFLGGMEMNLAIQMWQDTSMIACDELLQEMIDTLDGYLYGLLNAGDNEGRIVWTPATAGSARMLDDVRLFTYPVESQQPGGPFEMGVTLDTQWPYAEDLTQLNPDIPGTVVNLGNRPTYPVWQIWGDYDDFILTDTTSVPNQIFQYSGSQLGSSSVAAGEYIEIDTFRNSVTLVQPGPVLSNRKAGVVMANSEFFSLYPGNTTITLTYIGGGGGSSVGLVNAAWA